MRPISGFSDCAARSRMDDALAALLVASPGSGPPGSPNLSSRFSAAPLSQEVAFEEVDGPVVYKLRRVEAGKSVAFTFERHVFDRAPQLTQPVDHLVGLLARDARIV